MTDELEELLTLLGKHRFTMHEFQPDRDGPEVLAAIREFRACADVVVMLDQQRACAWRTPRRPDLDLLAPTHVFWVYAANPVWTLRALLTLPPPGHPDAPADLIGAPDGLGLPTQNRKPARIRIRGHTQNGSAPEG